MVDQKEGLRWIRETTKAEKKKLLFHLPEAQDLQEAMSNPHAIPRVSYGYMIAMALQVIQTTLNKSDALVSGSTVSDRYSDDHYSGSDHYGGLNNPDNAMLFSYSGRPL